MNRGAKFNAAIALSSEEKSVTVRTHTTHTITNKQTVTDITTPCPAAYVDNKSIVFNVVQGLQSV